MRGHKNGPRPAVRAFAVDVGGGQPLLKIRRTAVDADPGTGLDMNNIVRSGLICVEIILDAHEIEIVVVIAHIEKRAHLPVPGIGVLHPVIVPVTVTKNEHRMVAVPVHIRMRTPNILGLERAVSPAAILIALIAAGRHGDDFLRVAVGGINVLNVMRLVRPRREHLRWRPNILKLNPCAAEFCGGGVLNLGRIRSAGTRVRPREVRYGPEKMSIVHDHPL